MIDGNKEMHLFHGAGFVTVQRQTLFENSYIDLSGILSIIR